MKINQKGIDLIKKFEGLRLKTYLDAVGIPTIGYGTTGKDIVMGMTITEAEAEKRLKTHLESTEKLIGILVGPKLTDNEFSALCCLVYNIGGGNFQKSTLLRKLNDNVEKSDVAKEFLRWNKAGGKELAGLTKRRKAEMELFLTP